MKLKKEVIYDKICSGNGMSYQQISNLTGFPVGIVRNACRDLYLKNFIRKEKGKEILFYKGSLKYKQERHFNKSYFSKIIPYESFVDLIIECFNLIYEKESLSYLDIAENLSVSSNTVRRLVGYLRYYGLVNVEMKDSKSILILRKREYFKKRVLFNHGKVYFTIKGEGYLVEKKVSLLTKRGIHISL